MGVTLEVTERRLVSYFIFFSCQLWRTSPVTPGMWKERPKPLPGDREFLLQHIQPIAKQEKEGGGVIVGLNVTTQILTGQKRRDNKLEKGKSK
jgi:hypothetical protein